MKMIYKILISCFVLVLFLLPISDGLKCYTCSTTEDDSDTSCADDVTALGTNAITDCDKKYCTIIRVDYKDPRGKLSSFSRNCVDKVDPDGVVEDQTYRTYHRSCKTDLCNSGNGKGNIPNSNNSLGDKSTIYAPGVETNFGLKHLPSFVVIIQLLCIVLIV